MYIVPERLLTNPGYRENQPEPQEIRTETEPMGMPCAEYEVPCVPLPLSPSQNMFEPNPGKGTSRFDVSRLC